MINGSGLSLRVFLRGAGVAVVGLSRGRLGFEPAKGEGATFPTRPSRVCEVGEFRE